MPGGSFVSNFTLPELGIGAGFALWGFRGCALRCSGCCAMIQGFERAFGEEAGTVLSGMRTLVRAIGYDGRRKVTLSKPGCARVTADEISIAAMFAAAQTHNTAARDAHLVWLLARQPSQELSDLATRIADSFVRAGLRIVAPAAEVGPQAAAPPVLHGPGFEDFNVVQLVN